MRVAAHQTSLREEVMAMSLPIVRSLRAVTDEAPRGMGDVRRLIGIERATRNLLLGGVMPTWLGAGLADWYLHRRTRIQDTAGPRESALHLLMFAETGVPVLLGLFCEIDAAVLLSAYSAIGVHSATAYWDQIYAEDRRRVSPFEQHIHSLLEVSPIMAGLLLTALHWDQALALAGRGRPQFAIRLKRRDPLSASTRAWLLAAVGVFGVLPYAEEFWRCWRTSPTLEPIPEPAIPATDTLRIPADDGGIRGRGGERSQGRP
jgi:hypothetical protein